MNNVLIFRIPQFSHFLQMTSHLTTIIQFSAKLFIYCTNPNNFYGEHVSLMFINLLQSRRAYALNGQTCAKHPGRKEPKNKIRYPPPSTNANSSKPNYVFFLYSSSARKYILPQERLGEVSNAAQHLQQRAVWTTLTIIIAEIPYLTRPRLITSASPGKTSDDGAVWLRYSFCRVNNIVVAF